MHNIMWFSTANLTRFDALYSLLILVHIFTFRMECCVLRPYLTPAIFWKTTHAWHYQGKPISRINVVWTWMLAARLLAYSSMVFPRRFNVNVLETCSLWQAQDKQSVYYYGYCDIVIYYYYDVPCRNRRRTRKNSSIHISLRVKDCFQNLHITQYKNWW